MGSGRPSLRRAPGVFFSGRAKSLRESVSTFHRMTFEPSAMMSVPGRSVRPIVVTGSSKNQLRTEPLSVSRRWIRKRLISVQ